MTAMKPNEEPSQKPHSLADDLLRGAHEIAEFIFGEPASRRKVYYLAEYTRLPVFRLGSQLCARRSVLLKWIATQENRGLAYAETKEAMPRLAAVAIDSKGAG
jgi:hypothetical protein